ncbi:phasin family protein [Pseudahrensia aquimaris]|uniref:Phasin family protein n=1 Tax=Pseudahrensia aquimaris TaxID=744461 RepID=A0ABW3FKQ0_9HYPH
MSTKTTEAKEVFEKSQEFATSQIASSEKAFESMIEYNAAMFKGMEAIGKKMYDNYVSNVASAFDGMKALNKTNDVADFYKVAMTNAASSTERVMDQTKAVAEMSGKVMKETGEAGRLAFSKGFAINF